MHDSNLNIAVHRVFGFTLLWIDLYSRSYIANLSIVTTSLLDYFHGQEACALFYGSMCLNNLRGLVLLIFHHFSGAPISSSWTDEEFVWLPVWLLRNL